MKRFYRLNQYITAPKVRVVDEQGKQVGVIETQKALINAREKGVDLVEVAPKADPPVCKLIDFKKFKYLEQKKQAESRKKAKKHEVKEVRFTPFISKNDLHYRIKKAEEFLKHGHKVKITVKFVGRQITRKQYGYELLKQVNEQLSSLSTVELEPKFIGKLLSMTLAPVTSPKQGKKEEDEKKEAKKNKTKN